ncbi:hypothetical protein [Nocardia terpenica]|uniref:Uncharacterized protein n=1 Tax=Nocardia terpenica TaxID=455432 RepID=A0A291RRV2_9NOCA|nr:hypothetical protein [Nocardia terpenica]ATL69978.1 hypothetical protein CRH09_31145 [Nocardia terpenica]
MSPRAGARATEPSAPPIAAPGDGRGTPLRSDVSIWLPQANPILRTTLVTNASGGSSIGVPMVRGAGSRVAHRLLRSIPGASVLDGFATISARSAKIRKLLESDAKRTARGYFGGRWTPGTARRLGAGDE